MKLATIIQSLTGLGFEVAVAGDEIMVRRAASKPLNPECVKPLLKGLKQHKTAVIAYLKKMRTRLQDIPFCNDCPWCLENPWTHYPEFPKWCGWYWDHLLADNPQCRDRRVGRVPDPKVTPQPDRHAEPFLIQPETAAGTCYECRHYQPASPNPTQAWGWCRHLGKGRYGVARACDALVKTPETNWIFRQTRQIEKHVKSVFNRTNDRIEWAAWTWNPVTGCKHGCPYCYARDIAKRFFPPEIGFNPHFWPERLEAPGNTMVPKSGKLKDRLVFVTSMGDLFGDWVPQAWIDAVLKEVREAPQWTFIFLTKNPKRYLEIGFPVNAWVGATADTQARAAEALKVFSTLHHGNAKVPRPSVLFLSMEPLREKIELPGKLSAVDWLIIGGQSKSSGEPARQPQREWVEKILRQAREAECPVFCKPNLTVVSNGPREFPRPSCFEAAVDGGTLGLAQ